MTLLRCANGHEWEVPAGEGDLAGGGGGAPPGGEKVPSSGGLLDLSAPHPAPVIAGYEILEELGRGGMSIVYRARQVERNRVVALKVIRKERLTNPDMVTRF